ncbi:triphosphoribosyl-dephospho-CoA synthase CitG [Cetobacterium sp. SF1]|uniref:triphosphoribosyl-dephospho-CoA synthase CitG n=1 Tax=Cetobacterium sp. SF1 TaxID=3417654 RepID=UPI003CF6B8DC
MFNLDQFLLDREERADRQFALIDKFNLPLISLRSNYPGENKNAFIPREILEIIHEEIQNILGNSIKYEENIISLEGKTFLLIVKMNAIDLKKLVMEIEEKHLLGRCVDIDIFNENKEPLSRTDLGYSKRKCFLCDNLAFACGRSMAHTHEEIQDNIKTRYINYLSYDKKRENIIDTIGDLALKAMILEVSAFPSFGLVSPLSNGSHKDMNFFTFIDSSFAIKPYLKKMAKVGFSPLSLDIIFSQIRKIGIVAEEEMFLATSGVNTHKGMIFLMGIAVAITSKVLYEDDDFSSISKYISLMCKDILKDFENININSKLTHGEKLFLNHGITGIRGEVKNGLQSIFKGSIDIFEESLNKDSDINKAMIQTLLFLMGELEDSTILHRQNIDTLKEIQKTAKKLLKSGGIYNSENVSIIKTLEDEYITRRISPGGAADSLAVTIFLSNCKNILFK